MPSLSRQRRKVASFAILESTRARLFARRHKKFFLSSRRNVDAGEMLAVPAAVSTRHRNKQRCGNAVVSACWKIRQCRI